MTLAGLRLSIAALVLFPAAKPHLPALFSRKKDAFLLGLFNCAIPFTLFAHAMRSLPAGHGAILNATTPLFVALLGSLFFGKPQSSRVWLGLLVGLSGVVLTMEPWRHDSPLAWLPALEVLCASACYGMGANLSGRFSDIPPLALAWANTCTAALLLLIPAAAGATTLSPPPSALAAAVALGLISTAFAWAAYFKLFQIWGPLNSTMVTYATPFTGMALGWAFLGEAAKAGWWPGLALVFVGMRISMSHGKEAL
jgi:drug/metabolite transporter (DMT)-like permease